MIFERPRLEYLEAIFVVIWLVFGLFGLPFSYLMRCADEDVCRREGGR